MNYSGNISLVPRVEAKARRKFWNSLYHFIIFVSIIIILYQGILSALLPELSVGAPATSSTLCAVHQSRLDDCVDAASLQTEWSRSWSNTVWQTLALINPQHFRRLFNTSHNYIKYWCSCIAEYMETEYISCLLLMKWNIAYILLY